MSISFSDLIFYAFGIFVLFLTPGPVWIAIISRSITGGLNGAAPLAAGVAIGDIIWPTLAIAGSAALAASYANLLFYLKYLAVIIFVMLGINLINNQNSQIGSQNLKLSKRSELAGFTAGLLVIIGNPKAVYSTPDITRFFNLSKLTIADCITIALVSSLIPFLGNLTLAVMVEKSREILSSAAAVRKLNILSGCLLIFVGLLIFIEAIKHQL